MLTAMWNRWLAGRTHLRTTQGGYSLIELMVVITIIGILASLVVVMPVWIRDSSSDQERADDIASIARQLESAYNNQTLGTPAYPSTIEMLISISNRIQVMKDIEPEVLRAPSVASSVTSSVKAANSTSITTPLTSGIDADTYVYQPFTRSGTLCTAYPPSTQSQSTTCVRFNLYYYSVYNKSLQKVSSIRQQ